LTWDNNNSWRWNAELSFEYSYEPGVVRTLNDSGSITQICPAGWTTSSRGATAPDVYCSRPDQLHPPCEECDAKRIPILGNPISLSPNPVKQQIEVDYENALGTLRFVRTYRSDLSTWTHNYQLFAADFNSQNNAADTACFDGDGTSKGEPYCYPWAGRGTTNSIGVKRPNGSVRWFGDATSLAPVVTGDDRVSRILDQNGQLVGISFWDSSIGTTEKYDATGRIRTSTDRNGQVTVFAYSNAFTPFEVAPAPGLLISVTDHYGSQLQFTYDSKSRLKTMTDPAGGVFMYTPHELFGFPVAVQYPDGKTRRYIHGEGDKTNNEYRPRALTGIVDELENRLATFTYGSAGKPASTEHAGGTLKYTRSGSGTAQTVVDPLGTTRTVSVQCDHI